MARKTPVAHAGTPGHLPADDPVAAPAAAPTDGWLAAVEGMPPLSGPAGTAERLLLLLHYGIDWSSWVGGHRATYWDQLLPDRVVVSSYRAANLRQWWTAASTDLQAIPRNRAERRELEQLLRADSVPVLQVMRTETAALILRVRIVAESVRETRESRQP